MNILLLIEFAMLLTLVIARCSIASCISVYLFVLSFITLTVCEACVGIRILIKISRNRGRDLLEQP